MSESAKDSILQNMLAVEERSSQPAGNENSKKTTSPKPSTPPKKRGRPRNSSKTSQKTVETNVVVSPVHEATATSDENLEDEENAPIFKPNKGPQTLFLSAPEQEVLYGGAAGGGKSYALLADGIRYAMYPDYVGLILRRTNDELRELIQKSQLLYPKAYPGAKWRQKQSEWQFPSGARLWFAFLDNDEDVMRYQGQAFAYIGFDELTQYPTPYPWDYLRSRLRTTNPEIPLQQRATSNPGGPGHCVKEGDVYTPSGWKDIRDIVPGDVVYTVAPDGNLTTEIVDNVTKMRVSEPLVTIKCRGMHIEATKQHRLALAGYGEPRLTAIKDLPGQCTVLRSATFQGKEENTIVIEHTGGKKRKHNQPHVFSAVDYYALVGWFVSEGCRIHRDKAVNIAQCKPHTRKIIEDLLTRMGFVFSTSKTGFTIYCPSLYAHMARYGDGCENKRLTDAAKNTSNKNMESLLRALMLGDGCKESYYTSSKQLQDDVGDIAFKLGYIVYFTERQRDNRKTTSYSVSMKKTKSGGTEILTGNHKYNVSTTCKRKSDISEEHYDGLVYCIGVPNTHNFIIRQKGSVWVSGNSWVRKMFIEPSKPNKPFWARSLETGEVFRFPKYMRDGATLHLKSEQPLFQRKFIPASLYDNPYLTMDANYEANLMSLPEIDRKRLLDGDWDIVSGAAFPEFNRKIHSVEPFHIPSGWTRFRACDYGYGSHSSVLWFAVHPSGQLIIYREMYVTGITAEDLAEKIVDLETEYGDRISYGILDSSMWHKRGDTGPSMAEKMIRKGCKWRPSDRSKGSRISGKNEIHRILKVDPFLEQPRLIIFNTCTNILSHLPTIPLDKKNPEDVDTHFVHDHSYDALRYGSMSRPKSRSTLGFGESQAHHSPYQPVDPTFGA